jgi:hypothetical protein
VVRRGDRGGEGSGGGVLIEKGDDWEVVMVSEAVGEWDGGVGVAYHLDCVCGGGVLEVVGGW